VLMLVPTVYAVDVPLVTRIKLEILRSHKFFRIFSPIKSDLDRLDQILNSFHILTVETLFMFTLAMCYDVDVS
jgi:hypothetical protein